MGQWLPVKVRKCESSYHSYLISACKAVQKTVMRKLLVSSCSHPRPPILNKDLSASVFTLLSTVKYSCREWMHTHTPTHPHTYMHVFQAASAKKRPQAESYWKSIDKQEMGRSFAVFLSTMCKISSQQHPGYIEKQYTMKLTQTHGNLNLLASVYALPLL